MSEPESALRVYRAGSHIGFTLKVRATGSDFTWLWDAGTEWAATLLLNAIREQLGSSMRDARERAYKEGWRDAKAKRVKQSWFSGRLP